MKFHITIGKSLVLLCLLSSVALSQDFVRKMQDPGSNLYAIKASFDDYWVGRQMEKGKGWKQFQRWYHFWEPRVYPDGFLPPANQTQQALIEYRQQNNKATSVPPYTADWTALGPFSWVAGSYSPGQGRVNGITVDTQNSDRIYAGTPAGGLWISSDGGNSWMTTTDSLEALGVTSIAVDHFDSNTIYIASGDGDAADTYSLGVLKSTDGGQSWQQTGLNWNVLQTRRISKLLIHPLDPNILLAATDIGLYRTADGGQTWTQSRSGNFKDLEFHPTDPNIVYIAGTSFFRSIDNGQSFETSVSGLPSPGQVNRLAISLTPANPNLVYVLAGASGSSGFQGFYASTDAGQTFTQRSNSPNLMGWELDGSDSGGQSWYDLAIAASPVDADEVFVGGVNIWRTTDGGISWNINTHWIYPPSAAEYVHADIHSLDFYGTTLFAGCDGGIFKTEDFGDNWIDLSAGIVNTQFYRMGGYPGDPGLIVAGAQDNGSMRLAGQVWTQVFGADGMEAAIDYSNPDIMYVCYQNGGLLKSTNGGTNFFDIAPSSGAWITPYLLDPVNPERLYAGYNPLYVSENGGINWSQITIPGLSGSINHLAISPADNNVLYVGRFNQIFRSDNRGQSWQSVTVGLPVTQASISYFYASPLEANHIWVTFSGYSNGQKVYRSTDGGLSWENYSGSLPNLPANCVVTQDNLEEGVYVGTDVGVYYRNLSMDDWIPFYDGLPNVIVDELEIHKASGMIRAATFGRGIWESPLAGSGPFISHRPLTDTEDPNGPYMVEATVTPGSSPLVSDVYLHYGINGSIVDSVLMVATQGNQFSTSFPGPGVNALVSYYFSAADQEGFRNSLPITAPQSTFGFVVGPDTIAPQVNHQPLFWINQLSPAALVEVIATDERGIDTAFVEFSLNQTSPGTFALAGNDSLFSGTFPFTGNDLQIGDSVSYTVIVRDGAIANNEVILGPFQLAVRRVRSYLQQQIVAIPDNDSTGVSLVLNVPDDGNYFISSLELLFNARHGLIGDLTLKLAAPDGRTITLMDRPGHPGFPIGNLANDPDIRFSDSASISIENISFTTNQNVVGIFRPDPDLLETFNGISPLGDWVITLIDNRAGFPGEIQAVGLDIDLTNLVGIDGPQHSGVPESFELMQNFPNPFNPATTISFQLPYSTGVRIDVFNTLGQHVKTLVETHNSVSLQAGTHYYQWDGDDANGIQVSSGIYFYRLTADKFIATKKMLLVR